MLLLPGFGQNFIILSNILLNSILVYPNKNLINNHVDYKSISSIVTSSMKRGISFESDIIFLFFISVFWFLN